MMQTQAYIYGGEDLIYIKEGTIIGRTMTDREVVEEVRKDPPHDYEYYRPDSGSEETDTEPTEPGEEEEKNQDKVLGNYIRIIMRDLDDTVIENVEDYMKIDELGQSQGGSQEYQFQEGDLEILADAICHEGCGNYCAGLLGSSSEEDKLYLAKSTGYTIINKLNTDSGFNPDYNDPSNLWDSSKSPLYNLLCRIPDGRTYQEKAQAYGFTTGLNDGWYAIAPDLRHRIETNTIEYCDICYEAAEYIKENDSMNHTNNGKFGSQFATGEGMPHTCWEQGSGYDGTSTIWVHIPSADFYLFDTAD